MFVFLNVPLYMWCDSFRSLSSSRTLLRSEKAIDIFVVTSNNFFLRKTCYVKITCFGFVCYQRNDVENIFPSSFLMFSSLIYCIQWPNYTTLICLNIKYHLKYANIQKLHEKLFLMNGKGRKCPKCLTIKINGSIFFLIKKKETEKRAHYFLKKNKKWHVVRNIAQNSHASKLLSRLAQDSLRPKVKVFKRLFYI